MINCCSSDCYQIKVVDPCISEENSINFGTIEEVSTQVIMFALNIASQRIDQYIIISSITGELIFAPENPEYFAQLVPFRFFFRIGPLEPNLEITIDTNTYECIEITFGSI